LNKYYIAHAFQKKYGVSIVKFLNTVRCNEAKKLLETTDLSITEIAISVGFNSSSHFTETYKKIIGETPAQTRKRFYKQE
jgi:transcriptional regulator GlxA family with amidase domain